MNLIVAVALAVFAGLENPKETCLVSELHYGVLMLLLVDKLASFPPL